ncbi:hypothetical protein MVES1_000806 [Malassezia vespertilionis]|uniref:Transmembrane protein n=1 Tax=Malassezia vespertilionis TaxID=2020962 RepID=A0A2N1JEK8_9BASI|nr:uncharacterized protein MVES1_000806 [Malassezia vespertilionis]PKI84983.1 hypothetical protein MVES_000754 [Malassezia vespertilionis]WFD05476.1 hypothetical protein MVES1_000806 [Malassezia vespertilionis]
MTSLLRRPVAHAGVYATRFRLAPRRSMLNLSRRMYSTEEQKTGIAAMYVGSMRVLYYRLKLFSLSTLSVASVFAPLFVLWPSSIETVGRIGIAATTLAASGTSTALISWIGAPYVGHMTLRRSSPNATPMHYLSDGTNMLLLDDSPSDPKVHASEPYILELATLDWRMRSLKTTVYSPSLLRKTERAFASWELPPSPPPLLLDQGVDQRDSYTVSKLVAETVDVSGGKVRGRWWARWRVDPNDDQATECAGTCEAEGTPVRYFFVDESRLGDDWRVIQ